MYGDMQLYLFKGSLVYVMSDHVNFDLELLKCYICPLE